MPVFETSVALDCPQERAFDFLLQPANIARIAPPELGLSFVSAPETLELGSLMEFKIQGYGHVQKMVHEITDLVRPTVFTEAQIRGLFASWVHEHAFETNDRGQAVVIDRITFLPPAGLLGLLVTSRKILEQLEEGFDHRHAQLQKLLTEAG